MQKNQELIDCFKDTLEMINTDADLLNRTKLAMQNSVLVEQIQSRQYEKKYNTYVCVLEDTSFNTAKKLAGLGNKVAVLNFASAVNAGGGVTLGAMAQEECLCRSSNLLPCLKQKRFMQTYYMPHRLADDPVFSDKIIYTKGVTVFKTDDTVPVAMPKKEWFTVDVITCAAPNLTRFTKAYDDKELKAVFKSRIEHILNCAYSMGADSLVLGAFGCGAFGNSPELVANAFKEVIESEFEGVFNNIAFAVKKSSNSNYETFFRVFNQSDGEEPETEPVDFNEWRENNPYFGKKFSILGDSISALDGSLPEGYDDYYNTSNGPTTGVNGQDDMWWGKVISFFGGELLVNNSYSGSTVTSESGEFPSGFSKERIDALGKDGESPDVIIIFLGFNDWSRGVPVISSMGNGAALCKFFDYSYFNMVISIGKKYPNAEVWCCTVNKNFVSGNSAIRFDSKRGGVEIEEYNNVIRNASKSGTRKLIDIYSLDMPNDTLDCAHPNADGMLTVAKAICRSVVDNPDFWDDDSHYAKNAGKEPIAYQGAKTEDDLGDEYLCKNCGARLNPSDAYCLKCGTKTGLTKDVPEEPPKPDEPEVPEMIGDRYKIIRLVGRGHSARVYLAQDIKLDRICAAKIVNKNTYANKVAARESLDEANKIKSLAHVSIPQLYDIYDTDDRLCIILEFVEGKNLRDIIRSVKEPLKESKIIDWSMQLCRVLYYLHTLHPPRVFRDLKPENVILQPNNLIKLIDFGTMKNYDESSSEDTVNIGTRGYAAPEQFGGRGATDARTDIYGLGMTMYHLITGVNPSESNFEYKPIRHYRPDISPQLEKIVTKCIAIERENRYQNARDVYDDLDRIS